MYRRYRHNLSSWEGRLTRAGTRFASTSIPVFSGEAVVYSYLHSSRSLCVVWLQKEVNRPWKVMVIGMRSSDPTSSLTKWLAVEFLLWSVFFKKHSARNLSCVFTSTILLPVNRVSFPPKLSHSGLQRGLKMVDITIDLSLRRWGKILIRKLSEQPAWSVRTVLSGAVLGDRHICTYSPSNYRQQCQCRNRSNHRQQCQCRNRSNHRCRISMTIDTFY
jgi:hypothetical protein